MGAKLCGMRGEMMGKKLLKIFLTMLYISAFTFGGGFVIVTLMKKKMVDEYHWITEEEMLDMTALAQSAPGPIAVNAAILTGWQTAGLPGMLAATIGTVIPPIVILGIISIIYEAFSQNLYVRLVLNGMQAGVAAIIADVTIGLFTNVLKTKKIVNISIMAIAFILACFFKVNVVLIILGAAVVGVVCALVERGKKHA